MDILLQSPVSFLGMPSSYPPILGLPTWEVEAKSSPRSGWCRLVSRFGILALIAGFRLQAHTACSSPEALVGSWDEAGSTNEFRFETDRVILWEKGLLRVVTILRKEPSKIAVRDQGVRATWSLRGTEPAPERSSTRAREPSGSSASPGFRRPLTSTLSPCRRRGRSRLTR